MVTIKLAKACRRREKGAPMLVSERAAYKMMADGLAVKNKKFISDFEMAAGIKETIFPGKPGKERK